MSRKRKGRIDLGQKPSNLVSWVGRAKVTWKGDMEVTEVWFEI